MSVNAGDVLKTYYRLREDRGTRPPTYYRKRCWEHAEAFLAWCAKQEIDNPLGFLRYRFEVGDHGRYVPKLNQLRSNKLAEVWRQWREGQQLEDDHAVVLEQKAGTKAEQAIKELRLLTRGMEAAKHPYASTGRHELCLAEVDVTGGFHPESRYCPTCPVGVRCAAQLYQRHGFDVVSLRAGRLHVLPREVAAAAVR